MTNVMVTKWILNLEFIELMGGIHYGCYGGRTGPRSWGGAAVHSEEGAMKSKISL